jgi:uncharacterized membrane protein
MGTEIPVSSSTLPPLRCTSERIIQTLAYECVGLVLVAPLYVAAFGSSAQESVTLLFTLSLLVMTWTPVFNSIFDWVDRRLSGRTASERPHGLRILHAVSLEVTSVAFTLPAVMLIGDYSFWEALLVDIGLTIAYAIYAYVFHFAFDKFRPVTRGI